MKKIILSTITAVSILTTSSHALFGIGDVVYDPIQTGKSIVEHAKQAKRWSEEILHYKSQLDAYKNQLLSQTDIRDSVQFVKDLEDFYKFSKEQKNDFLSLDVDILNSNSQIGQKAKQLFEEYNLFNSCEVEYHRKDYERICKNKMIRRVQEVATYQEYSNTLDNIGENITKLGVKLTEAKDIKESQDINNAIQIQVAQLDLIKNQVELMNAQNERLDKIEIEQSRQLMDQRRMKKDTLDYTGAFGD